MIERTTTSKRYGKLFLFYLLWWGVGIVIASIWGLGWFFLIETLRRIITYFPPLRRSLRKLLVGIDAETETTGTSAMKMASQIMPGLIIVGWIGLTIFVFWKANISLETIIDYYRAAK
jgi:hypothetical protein